MAVLRIHAPVLGRQERVFEWDGRPITVGRDEACDVVLLEQAASRRHARLEREGDEIRVIDCDSANGVFVGEERVEGSRALHDGDVVRIGETTLTLVLDPHRQPTLIRAAVEDQGGLGSAATVAGGDAAAVPVRRDDIGSGPTLAAPGASGESPAATASPEVEPTAPSAPPEVEPPSPPPPVALQRPAPVPAASSPSAYSLGSEPTLTAESRPNFLGIHDRSSPSTYSLGSEPTLAAESRPDFLGIHDRSAPSVYSLGHEPVAPREPGALGSHAPSAGSVYSLGNEPVAPREPDAFGSHLPSTGSTYSLGQEPVAPAREPDAFVPRPSSASVYSLGDAPVADFRGPDVLPPVPAFDGAASSVELGAAPPRPGAVLPLPPPPSAPPVPAEPLPRPPAFVVPPQARSAASSWEWSEPAPADRRRRRHPAGPALWLGLGLFIGGIVAMIVGLAAGYAPSDLRSLFDTSVVLGGQR